MTVQEFIEQLGELDPQAPVMVDYEGMLVNVKQARKVVAHRNLSDYFFREDGFGTLAEFLAAEWVDDEDKAGAFEAVEVGR